MTHDDPATPTTTARLRPAGAPATSYDDPTCPRCADEKPEHNPNVDVADIDGSSADLGPRSDESDVCTGGDGAGAITRTLPWRTSQRLRNCSGQTLVGAHD